MPGGGGRGGGGEGGGGRGVGPGGRGVGPGGGRGTHNRRGAYKCSRAAFQLSGTPRGGGGGKKTHNSLTPQEAT